MKIPLNLYFVMTNFMYQISRHYFQKDDREKVGKLNCNDSYKSRSSLTNFKLDLCFGRQTHVPGTKFQVNISKDGREKFGKLNFRKGH